MAPTHSLTTDAFARLRKDSAWARWPTGSLHGIQRAVASLGHCYPPSLSKHGSMPAIEGTAETWAAWGERWILRSTQPAGGGSSPKTQGASTTCQPSGSSKRTALCSGQ